MDKYILPGMLIKDLNAWELNVGDRVYDRSSGNSGSVVEIRETAPEWVEAFIRFDGSDSDVPAWKYPNCIYLGQNDK